MPSYAFMTSVLGLFPDLACISNVVGFAFKIYIHIFLAIDDIVDSNDR